MHPLLENSNRLGETMIDLDRLKQEVEPNKLADHLGMKLDRDGKGRCPTGHPSKSGKSFSITDFGSFHCFGCGKTWDVIAMTEQIKGFDFQSALKYLVENFAPHLSENQSASNARSRREAMNALQYTLHRTATNSNSETGELKISARRATDYIISRGFSSDVMQKYEIGYTHRKLVDHALAQKKFTMSELVSLGVCSPSQNYFTKDRLTIPIKSCGKLIGWSMRAMGNAEPKYYNIYHKDWDNSDRWLAGLETTGKDVVVCEGIFDMMSLKEAGYNACATLGTNFSEERIKLLDSFESIVIMFDSDEAGLFAAEKFFFMARKIVPHVKLYFTANSEGKDANSMELIDLQRCIAGATTPVNWLLNRYLVSHNPENLIVDVARLRKSLEQLPEMEQDMYEEQIKARIIPQVFTTNLFDIHPEVNDPKYVLAVEMRNTYSDLMRGDRK